jgi:hypothetical protein
MTSMRFLLALSFTLAITQPVAAGALSARYENPCQPRAAFVSRLRSLVRHPERIEVLLTEYSIVVAQDAASAWTLTVDRTGTEESAPRTVRDSSCEAVSEAAALVVSAWIDEREPIDEPVAKSAPPPAAAPAPATPPEPTPIPEPTTRQGFTLKLEAVTALSSRASASGAGISLGFWNLSASEEILQVVGLTIWPHFARFDSTELNRTYQRDTCEVFLELSALWVHFGDFRMGPVVKFSLGGHEDADGVDVFMTRVTAGVIVRWKLSEHWAVRYQIGALMENTRVGHPALANTLGIDAAVF